MRALAKWIRKYRFQFQYDVTGLDKSIWSIKHFEMKLNWIHLCWVLSCLLLPIIVLGGFYLSTMAYLQVPDFWESWHLRKTMVKFFKFIYCHLQYGNIFLLLLQRGGQAARGWSFIYFLICFCVVVYKCLNGNPLDESKDLFNSGEVQGIARALTWWKI